MDEPSTSESRPATEAGTGKETAGAATEDLAVKEKRAEYNSPTSSEARSKPRD